MEFTKEDTVLVFANGMHSSILIPATVKRECVQELHRRGLSGPVFYLRLFARGLYFLLKDHIQTLSCITIDREYYGQEAKLDFIH